MYQEISASAHDDFAKTSQQTNLLQSSDWAKIKDTWGNKRVGFFDAAGKQIASASILIQPLPLGFTMLYIPRGPIMDYNNLDHVKQVMTDLKAIGKKEKTLFVKFDPAIFLKKGKPADFAENADNTEGLKAIDNLKKAGADWVGRTTDLAENIQPRFQANLYAETFSLEAMPKKTRQVIRTSQNKDVEIHFGGTELLADFAELMKKTEVRKGISLRGLDYYQKLLTTYPENSYVTMAFLNVTKRLNKIQTELDKAESEKANFTEKTRQSKIDNNMKTIERLTKEKQFLNQAQAAAQRDLIPIAATISLEFGDTSENIYAGMDDHFKTYQAPIYTWFETAQHAFDRGMTWQNMGGIENDFSGGLYSFKSKFDPTIEEFIGEFNLPVHPFLYKLSNLAYTLRKKARSK